MMGPKYLGLSISPGSPIFDLKAYFTYEDRSTFKQLNQFAAQPENPFSRELIKAKGLWPENFGPGPGLATSRPFLLQKIAI